MADQKRSVGSYEADVAWCRTKLEIGLPVWCIRSRASGLIATYLAGSIDGWQTFDGQPLEDFTVTPVRLENDEVRFGKERLWPDPEPGRDETVLES